MEGFSEELLRIIQATSNSPLLSIAVLFIFTFKTFTDWERGKYMQLIKELEKKVTDITNALAEKDIIIKEQNQRISNLEKELLEITKENAELKGLLTVVSLSAQEKRKVFKQINEKIQNLTIKQ